MDNLKLLSTPFAQNGIKRNIIKEPESNTPNGRATYKTGFPEITMTPITNGGIPPSGADFNGIFNDLSSHIVHLNQGGRYKFNQALCDEIGGYKKGAILLNDTGDTEYISLIDNNQVNFNTAEPEQVIGKWDKVASNNNLVINNPNYPNGYLELNGGLIIQWGVSTFEVGYGYLYYQIPFNKPFSRNPFLIQTNILFDNQYNYDIENLHCYVDNDFYKYGENSADFCEAVNICLLSRLNNSNIGDQVNISWFAVGV